MQVCYACVRERGSCRRDLGRFAVLPVSTAPCMCAPATPSPPPSPTPQEVELGPLVGTGARGRCYRGQWGGARVAVKVIDIRLPCGDSAKEAEAEAARLEALLSRSLSHPSVVTTFAHGSSVTRVPGTDEQHHHQIWIVQVGTGRRRGRQPRPRAGRRMGAFGR